MKNMSRRQFGRIAAGSAAITISGGSLPAAAIGQSHKVNSGRPEQRGTANETRRTKRGIRDHAWSFNPRIKKESAL
jgi:hypothetical protein